MGLPVATTHIPLRHLGIKWSGHRDLRSRVNPAAGIRFLGAAFVRLCAVSSLVLQSLSCRISILHFFTFLSSEADVRTFGRHMQFLVMTPTNFSIDSAILSSLILLAMSLKGC